MFQRTDLFTFLVSQPPFFYVCLTMKHLTLFFSLFCIFAHAQTDQSTHARLWKGKPASIQIHILDSLSKAVRLSDYRLALFYSRQGLRIAQENQLHDAIVKNWLGVVQAYRAKNLFDSALIYIDSARYEATTFAVEKLMPDISNTEGSLYLRKSNNTKAASCFYEAVEFATVLKDSVNLQVAFNYLGTVAFYRSDYLSAANLYRRSRNYVNVEKKPEKFVSITDNIGLCYSNVGKIDS
ncbi:MAG: hypothetical protein ACRCYO_00015, partial [Bacteroidia bacterium]